jgi:hypothetical protein
MDPLDIGGSMGELLFRRGSRNSCLTDPCTIGNLENGTVDLPYFQRARARGAREK